MKLPLLNYCCRAVDFTCGVARTACRFVPGGVNIRFRKAEADRVFPGRKGPVRELHSGGNPKSIPQDRKDMKARHQKNTTDPVTGKITGLISGKS